jgi:hypothetical protein
VYDGDVRMIQRGERLGFPLEASDAFGVLGDGLWQDLDGNTAAQSGVGGVIDLTLPPTPIRETI